MSHKQTLHSGTDLPLAVTSDMNLDNSVFTNLVSSSMNGTNLPFHSRLHDVLDNIVCQLERIQSDLGDQPVGISMWEFLDGVSWVGRPILNVGDIIPWARGPGQNRNGESELSTPAFTFPLLLGYGCNVIWSSSCHHDCVVMGIVLLNCEPK